MHPAAVAAATDCLCFAADSSWDTLSCHWLPLRLAMTVALGASIAPAAAGRRLWARPVAAAGSADSVDSGSAD